jgi:hypothetical protein
MKLFTRWPSLLAASVLGTAVLLAASSAGIGETSPLLEADLTPLSSLAGLSVQPVLLTDHESGKALDECAQVGSYAFACKIAGWTDNHMNGLYICPLDPWAGDSGYNEITISKSDGSSFDWSAISPVGAVIVKHGPAANVFDYGPRVRLDSGLRSPDDASGMPTAVSHVTFCWDR